MVVTLNLNSELGPSFSVDVGIRSDGLSDNGRSIPRSFQTREDLVLWVQTANPKVGFLAFAEGHTYQYTGTSEEIVDLPGFVLESTSSIQTYDSLETATASTPPSAINQISVNQQGGTVHYQRTSGGLALITADGATWEYAGGYVTELLQITVPVGRNLQSEVDRVTCIDTHGDGFVALRLADAYQITVPVVIKSTTRLTIEQISGASVPLATTFTLGADAITVDYGAYYKHGFVIDATNGRCRVALSVFGECEIVTEMGAFGLRTNTPVGPDANGVGLFVWKGGHAYCVSPVDPVLGPIGPVFRSFPRVGVWVTYGARASIAGTDCTNTGFSMDKAYGCAAFFVSRAAVVQIDYSDCSGSHRGIRNGGAFIHANRLTGNNVKQLVWTFRGGRTSIQSGTFVDCGEANWPILDVSGEGNSVRGAGEIYADANNFTGAKSDLASATTPGGLITISEAQVDDFHARMVVVGSGARVFATKLAAGVGGIGAVASPNVANAALELIQVADGGEFNGVGVLVETAATMTRKLRLSNFAKVTLRNSTFDGAQPFVSISGSVTLELTTLGVDGTEYFPNGARLSDGTGFDTRNEAVQAVGLGWRLPNGGMFTAAGLPYRFDNTAGDPIADLPDVIPANLTTPTHFNATGDGIVDDRAMMIEWAAAGGAGVVLELKPGATYRVASRGSITFAAGSVVNGNGATILLDYTDTSNNAQIVTGARTQVEGLNVRWSGAGYAERGISVGEDAAWIGGKVYSDLEQPASAQDEAQDATMTITGARGRIEGVTFENIWAPIRTNAADARVFGCDFYAFGRGIAVEETTSAGLNISKNRFHTASSYGTQAPGEGPISGHADGMVVEANTVFAASEHGMYISGAALAVDVVVKDNVVFASGQSNYKIRNCDVRFIGNSAQDAAFGNSTGTTEDAAAFEDCPNVFVNGFTAAGRTKSNAGNYALRFDSCGRVAASGILTERAAQAVILITDERIRAALGGYEHVSTLINGLTVQDPGAGRLMDIVFGGDCGDVEAMGISFSGGSGTVLTTDIAGTAGKIMLQGAIDTTGTMHVNTAGGASVLIEAFWNRYVGGSLQRSYVDGKFTMYSGQFDLTAGATLGQFVRSTGTEATGAYIGGYGGSRLNSNRPGWAMVGKQGTSDADQVGAAILVKQSSASSDILVEAVEFAYNLHAKFAATVKTAAYAVSALPSASSLGSGARAMVSNGSVVAAGNFGNVVAGGGANIVPVYSDGTNWRIG